MKKRNKKAKQWQLYTAILVFASAIVIGAAGILILRQQLISSQGGNLISLLLRKVLLLHRVLLSEYGCSKNSFNTFI